MKKTLILLLLILFSISAQTTVSPAIVNNPFVSALFEPAISPSSVSSMKIKEIEELMGRKMSLKEKLAFKVFQWKIKKGYHLYKNNEKQRKGQTSLTFGIVSIASMFIPYLGFFALPFAILAIVIGNKAKRIDPNDRQANTGVILGWITIGVFVLAVIALAAIIASGGLVM